MGYLIDAVDIAAICKEAFMKLKLTALVLMLAVVFSAGAQTKEIRVLLANHPYGEVLKAAIPEFEKATGIKVNFESLQEAQLTTKLTTEFATQVVLRGRIHDPSAPGSQDVLQERLAGARVHL